MRRATIPDFARVFAPVLALAKTSPASLSVDFDLAQPWAYRQGARIRGTMC